MDTTIYNRDFKLIQIGAIDFDILHDAVPHYEEVLPGRLVANLVDLEGLPEGVVPIVRSTTVCKNKTMKLPDIYKDTIVETARRIIATHKVFLGKKIIDVRNKIAEKAIEMSRVFANKKKIVDDYNNSKGLLVVAIEKEKDPTLDISKYFNNEVELVAFNSDLEEINELYERNKIVCETKLKYYERCYVELDDQYKKMLQEWEASINNIRKISDACTNGHVKILQMLKSIPIIDFNNFMVEIYTDEYRTMKYHSDMALDLEPDSWIGIYSSYPSYEKKRRMLLVKNKETSEVNSIVLENGCMVMFSTETNTKYYHKIIGDAVWLGVTCRKSKHVFTPLKLHLANESEAKILYKARYIENSTVGFKWDSIVYMQEKSSLDYTVSPGDLGMIEI